MMKIATIVGARPQFIKSAVVSRALHAFTGVTEVIIHTGQHYDQNMSEIFFQQLDIPEPNYNLEVGSGSHGVQTGSMMEKIEDVLIAESPDWVLVYGDTNSTLAGAIVASKLNMPLAHVEAGLRSYNRSMPEEINRIATDHVSDILFAPTHTAMKILKEEGREDRTFFSGDVMYDSVLFYRGKIEGRPELYKIRGIPDTYFVGTIHRPENTDNARHLRQLFHTFARLDWKIIIPLHPRTHRFILEHSIDVADNVQIIEPVGYLQMLKLVMDSEKVLTDSGGLQKEAYFLEKPCITLRNETEWVETLHDGCNILTGTDPVRIIQAVHRNIESVRHRDSFGNGNAGEKIVQHLISKWDAYNATQ